MVKYYGREINEETDGRDIPEPVHRYKESDI